MAYLDIDTDTLRSAVNIARQANDEITEACRLLDQVVEHRDWCCSEREQINENTRQNKTKAAEIQRNSASFYQAVSEASTRFDETEQSNISRMEKLEEMLSQILTVVPNIAGGAPAITSFDGISNLLGG